MHPPWTGRLEHASGAAAVGAVGQLQSCALLGTVSARLASGRPLAAALPDGELPRTSASVGCSWGHPVNNTAKDTKTR